MSDLSTLSNADLQALWTQKSAPAPVSDLSGMSDADLRALYAKQNPDVEGPITRLARRLGGENALAMHNAVLGQAADYVGGKLNQIPGVPEIRAAHGPKEAYFEAAKGVPVYGSMVPQTPAMTQFEQNNPDTARGMQAEGAILATLPLTAAAPGAFGVGAGQSLAARVGAGALSNAALSGADTAVRGGSAEDIAGSAGIGAGIGGGVPVVGAGLGAGLDATIRGGSALAGRIGRMFGSAEAPISASERAAIEATPRGQAIIAAHDLGMKPLPAFVATDSSTMRSAAGLMANQPLTGGIVRNAAENASNDLGEAALRVADRYSNAGTGATIGARDATAAANSAGSELGDALSNWIGPESKNDLSALYSSVYSKISPTATIQLPHTTLMTQKIIEEAKAAATPALENQIWTKIGDAVTRPEGLTVRGAQDLRTYIGNMINDHLLPEAGTVQPLLKRIYGPLSTDIENGVRRVGGPTALADWQAAEATAREFSANRGDLTKILGISGDAPPELVFARIQQMAGTKSTADAARLSLAQQKAGPKVWNEVASAVIRRMGQGGAPNPSSPGMVSGFSPDRFLTAWRGLSDAGKDALFGAKGAQGSLRNSLENVATVSQKFANIRQFSNPSGTAHAMGAGTLFSNFFIAGPIGPIAQVGGAALASRMLSRPASAAAVSRWGNAVYNFTTTGKGAQVVRSTTFVLAHGIAQETGQDENEVRAKLYRAATGSMPPV